MPAATSMHGLQIREDIRGLDIITTGLFTGLLDLPCVPVAQFAKVLESSSPSLNILSAT